MKKVIYATFIAVLFSLNAIAQAVLPTSWSFTTPTSTYTQYTDVPLATSRYIRFIYTQKVGGNIGLDDVNIAAAPAGPQQEINITQGATTIIDGGSYTWSSPVSTMTPATFTIENLVTANTLNISSAVISGANAADFVVSASPSSVAAAGTAPLTVDFTPSVAGTRNAILTITSQRSS